MREMYWLYGSDTVGDGMHNNYTTFWKMRYYKDTNEPVTGEKLEITYDEFSRSC